MRIGQKISCDMLATRLEADPVVYMACCIRECFVTPAGWYHLNCSHTRFLIDAFTIFAVPAHGPHGFHAIGRFVHFTRVCDTLKWEWFRVHVGLSNQLSVL